MQEGYSNIWGGQGACQHPRATGRVFPTPHQKHTILCGRGQNHQTGRGECFKSYHVKTLFTSVPVGPAKSIIKQRFKQDTQLDHRTSISIQHIITLLDFCLKNTYFLFQGKYYEWVQGTAMTSPISPIVASLFMEGFEVKAISSAPHLPRLWLRCVDDTFFIQKAEHSNQFPQHINTTDPHMQFTLEATGHQGSIPFLDTLVTRT